MVCLYCGKPTKVVNSRAKKPSQQVWRRRRCTSCGNIFSTFEYLDYNHSLVVELSNQKIIPFFKEKLFISIYESCRHRKTATTDATALTATVISKLLKRAQNGKIKHDDIVELTKQTLYRFDRAAAVYYLAYHKV